MSQKDDVLSVDCPICLTHTDNATKLDLCFHTFCYYCILQWSKVTQECPLCKCPFSSLIHSINPITRDYKRYFISSDMRSQKKKRDSLSGHRYSRKFIYDTGMIPVLSGIELDEESHGKGDKRMGKWLKVLPGWLKKEVPVLIPQSVSEEEAAFTRQMIDVISSSVIGLIKRYGTLDNDEVREELEGFLDEYTDRFIKETMLFLRTRWSVDTFYDKIRYKNEGEDDFVDLTDETEIDVDHIFEEDCNQDMNDTEIKEATDKAREEQKQFDEIEAKEIIEISRKRKIDEDDNPRPQKITTQEIK
eukprot:TRINITY_DN3425_c0_g1_i1.p1 TRINITY_DN3425_c0_g1~~TRINITY_DN3425_c0_g1_i1.p1  ORF type:complete len:353 (-),score=76.70 TRINITY_DN3425_c0_g1_i1:6-914(-)